MFHFVVLKFFLLRFSCVVYVFFLYLFYYYCFVFFFFFFFQAEDGIRDIGVTGVQTCALPILCSKISTTRRGSTSRPVSSSASRRTPSTSFSPASTTPPGIDQNPLSGSRDRKSVV